MTFLDSVCLQDQREYVHHQHKTEGTADLINKAGIMCPFNPKLLIIKVC
jgi:hypothetical protein